MTIPKEQYNKFKKLWDKLGDTPINEAEKINIIN